jgi:hypothetical protein
VNDPRPLSRTKKASIVAASVLFVVLSVWQIHARREDWPLSRYDMYSPIQGRYATRKVLFGTSEHGEFSLSGVGYNVPPRFWFQFGRIKRNKRKVNQLLASVEKDYNSRRQVNPELPGLTGLAIYEERWKIQPRMRGVDKAKRKLLSRRSSQEPAQRPGRDPNEPAQR